MDATLRPIVFPPEFEHYVEEHNIFCLFEACLGRLVIARPDDPLLFLQETFSSPVTNIRKIIVLGPPIPERTVVCEKMSEMFQSVHVSTATMKGKQKPVQKKGGIKLKKVLVRFEKRVRDKHKKYFAKDTPGSRKSIPSDGQKSALKTVKQFDEKKKTEQDKTEESKYFSEEGKLEDLKEVVDETDFDISKVSMPANEGYVHSKDNENNIEEDVEVDVYEENDAEEEDTEGFEISSKESMEEEDATGHSTPISEEYNTDDIEVDDDDFLKYAWQKDVVEEEDESAVELKAEENDLLDEAEEEEIQNPIDTESEEESVLFRERTPLISNLMKQLNSQECETKGWVMEGLPRTRLEALSLQQWAVFPTHVIFLQFENAPSSTEVEEIINSSNKEEWTLYNEQILGIEDCYSRYYCQTFAIDKPLDLVLMNVLNFSDSKPSTNSPFTPRVLLLGLPGCGKSTQAQILAQKYEIVNIDFSELVEHVLSLESEWDSDNQSVVDNLAAEAVAERIHRKNALIGGYILHGFPSTLKQAEILCEKIKYRIPNKVIIIDVSKDVSYERLVYRRIDPFNRKFYHLITDPPIDDDLFLFQRPQDDHKVVTSRINSYLRNIKDLVQFFQGRLSKIDGEMTIEDVSEALLSAVVHPIPSRDYKLSVESSENVE